MNYIHNMNQTLPELNDLRVLKALLEDPHVTRCAIKLNLTQSAISHTLGRLRLHFSDPLFVRSKKGFEATSFLISLEPLLDHLLKSAEDISNHRSVFNPATSTRSFDIAMPERVSIPFIPQLLKNIRETAPYIGVNFRSLHPQDAQTFLDEGRSDLYIGTLRNISGSTKTQTLYKENFVCLARHEYKIFTNGKITKENFIKARHLKLALQGGQPSYVDQELAAFGIVRKNFVTLPFYLLGFEVMRHEDILVTAPKAMVDHVMREFSMKKFYKISPFPYQIDSLQVSQFWHIRADKDAGHTWLRQMVKQTGKLIAERM